jgi:hypothetical protein
VPTKKLDVGSGYFDCSKLLKKLKFASTKKNNDKWNENIGHIDNTYLDFEVLKKFFGDIDNFFWSSVLFNCKNKIIINLLGKHHVTYSDHIHKFWNRFRLHRFNGGSTNTTHRL